MSDEKDPLSRSVPSSPPSHRPLPLAAEAIPAFEPFVSLFKGKNNSIRLPNSPTTVVTSSVSHHANNAPPSFHPKAGRGHVRSSSVSSLKGKSWFSFSSSSSSSSSSAAATSAASRKPNNEVRTTVLNLVRDLVLEHSSGSPAALGILQSCAEACNSHNVSLSDILQEKFIEGHSPLYWAIVKRQPSDTYDDTTTTTTTTITIPELLDALIKQSSPLEVDTTSELRQACLVTSDHSMFQHLSILPHFTTTTTSSSGVVDKVILGSTLPPDNVTVELGSGNEGGFTVHLHLFQFHKRMMLSKEITHEFIARNRLWRISFMIMPDDDDDDDASRYWKNDGPPPGSWCVSISLQESSPPTWFDGQLSLSNSYHPLRLRSKHTMILEGPRNDIPAAKVVVPMDDSPDFATLQYSGNTFNPEDERLKVILEAKLRKSDFSIEGSTQVSLV